MVIHLDEAALGNHTGTQLLFLDCGRQSKFDLAATEFAGAKHALLQGLLIDVV